MIDRRDFFKKFSGEDERLQEPLDMTVPSLPTTALRAVPRAGSARDYQPGSWVYVEESRAWLGCDDVGFFAVDASCPHLGCLVRPEDEGFGCPCHGSRFDSAGAPVQGPAVRGLRYLEVDLDVDDRLVINRNKTVSPNDRFIA